jgi:hypothetical protein
VCQQWLRKLTPAEGLQLHWRLGVLLRDLALLVVKHVVTRTCTFPVRWETPLGDMMMKRSKMLTMMRSRRLAYQVLLS